MPPTGFFFFELPARGSTHLSTGHQQRQGDRQVEASAVLEQLRGRQVDRDAARGKLKARTQDRGAHALSALTHDRRGQADDAEARQASAQVSLDLHERRIEPELSATQHSRNADGAAHARARASARQTRRVW